VRHFQVGDLVLRSTLRDEHVPFPGGRSCWGGFVEKGIVTDVWAEKEVEYSQLSHPQQIVPAAIPAVEAVAMITLKETLSCLENSEVEPGHSLAIVGTGPVAQALTMFARLYDIHPVVVFGRRPEWAGLFERLGADGYAAGEAWPAEVRQIMADGGFDRAIEAAGNREALSRCLQVVSPAGKVNLYGIPPQSASYLAADQADRRVFRSRVAEAETHGKLLDWIQAGEIRLAEWISHQLPWTEFQRGFEMTEHKTANKVVLTFA